MADEGRQRVGVLDGFAILALVVTFLLRYAPFLASHLLFGPIQDNVYIYGPIFSEVSRLSLSGAVPYYLPDIGTGFPVFESPHFSILYPFYFFGLLNYGGPTASLYTLNDLTLFHVFLFYINLYVWLRCAAITPSASYIGASVGMLARNTEIYAGWLTIAASYAWLPLVLAGGVLLLRSPGKASGIILFSVALGLLILASASQPVIHAALACLILFSAGAVWMCLRRQFADVRRLVRSLVLCCGITFGLAGAAIVPMYIATGEMIRHIGGGASLLGHAPIPWENFNLAQVSLSQIAGIVIRPDWIAVIGSPYVGPLGAIGVLLVAIYFRSLDAFPRMLVATFGILGLYGLLSGFGTHLGLSYVNFHLPFLNRIREPGRHLVLFVTSVSFLSGLGYGLLTQMFRQYKQSHRASLLILPAILGLIFAGITLWELFHASYRALPTGFWMLALAPIVFVLGWCGRLSSYKNFTTAALFVSMAAMVIPAGGFSLSESDLAKPISLLSHRVLQRIASDIDASNYRVEFRDRALEGRLWAMNASYYGMKSFYNQITPQPYAQFRFMQLTTVPHLREMMGARYVLCGPGLSPLDRKARPLLTTDGYRLYENPNPMGRLTLVHRVAGRTDSETGQFVKVVAKGFNYLSEAYVTSQDFSRVADFLPNSPPSSSTQESILKIVDQPNRSYSTVESASASLLILNEWFTPAWKVRVNGTRQPVLRVNEWQTGVLLGAGTNHVEFEYRPTLFFALMVLNRVTGGLLILFSIFALTRNRWLRTTHIPKLGKESAS